jgi:hypothetical protein
MSRKAIKRAEHYHIDQAPDANGNTRYYVSPAYGTQVIVHQTFVAAKRYVDDKIWATLWEEYDADVKWWKPGDCIPTSMRAWFLPGRGWIVYPTIEREPENFRQSGTNVPSLYMIRLPGSTRWRRVKTDWHGNTANHHIYVGGPEGALRIDLQ